MIVEQIIKQPLDLQGFRAVRCLYRRVLRG